MTSYQNVSLVIHDMLKEVKKRNTTRFQKPHFMRVLLSNQITFKKTLNQTLRDNDRIIREWWMRDMHTTNKPNYYTIVGEVLVKYLNDNLERDLLNLTNTERERLIREINNETGLR